MSDWIRLSRDRIQSRPCINFINRSLGLLNASTEAGAAGENSDAEDLDEALAKVQLLAEAPRDAEDRAWCVAVSGVMGDLIQQGWVLGLKDGYLVGKRPLSGMTRDALRQRLLVRRDEQLMKSSVRDFVSGMERLRLFKGARVSIISLMRDGRALSSDLESGKPIDELIEPYLQFVEANQICSLTGLKVQDIWRYFRHTWSTPYESVPGRSLQFLVRDRASPFHPVIGIAALSSAAVRLGPRDRFIGWDTDQVVARLMQGDKSAAENWARSVLNEAVNEIYKVDLIRDQILSADPLQWSMSTAAECAAAAATAKEQHHRLMDGGEYKSDDVVKTEDDCIRRATMYLFRAKRAFELSKLIPMLIQVRQGLPEGTDFRDFLSKVIRIARSKSVGTEIADLTVCGSVAPYSHLAAGKLVAMLATSPQVITEYQRRYANSPGIIASSMAGRPIGRPANLCFIGTTSLYGRRPNQYDRLGMPASLVGGAEGQTIRFQHIHDESDSKTQGVGTFHFSSKTLKGLENFVSSGKGGWKVNNVFGEGTSPKLRALRDGLEALGLHAEDLLVHGIERCMYGVKLASNLDRYLLGQDKLPKWVFDPKNSDTAGISKWWSQRWASPRATKSEVLAKIRQDAFVNPIRHRAKVQLPDQDADQVLLI